MSVEMRTRRRRASSPWSAVFQRLSVRRLYKATSSGSSVLISVLTVSTRAVSPADGGQPAEGDQSVEVGDHGLRWARKVAEG